MTWRARLGALRYPVLALLAAALLWPGIALLPPVDRGETRQALLAAWVAAPDAAGPAFQDGPRWRQQRALAGLQSVAVALLAGPDRPAIWAARVPGALAALAAVLLTCHVGAVLYGPAAGFVAGLLLALSVLLGVAARLATGETVTLLVVLAAQTALLHIRRRQDAAGQPPARLWPLLFWAANAAGLILKTPLVLLASAGTLLFLCVAERRVAWLAALLPVSGTGLLLAMLLAWLFGMEAAADGSFFAQPPQDAMPDLPAALLPGLPPGTNLALFLPGFWPGSLFAALALPWAWAGRRAPPTRFLLAWIVPAWVVLALAAAPPLDLLVVWPALAVLTAAAICAPARPGQMLRWLGRLWVWLWAATGVALAFAGPVLLLWLQGRLVATALLGALVAVTLTVQARRLALRAALRPALACAGAAMLAIALTAALVVAPGLQALWLGPRIAAAVRALRPCPDSVLAAAAFAEPGLPYLLGGRTRLTGPAMAAEFLNDQPACGLALVDAGDAPAFLERARLLDLTPRPLARIDGIDLPAWRRLSLTLYAAAPAP